VTLTFTYDLDFQLLGELWSWPAHTLCDFW